MKSCNLIDRIQYSLGEMQNRSDGKILLIHPANAHSILSLSMEFLSPVIDDRCNGQEQTGNR